MKLNWFANVKNPLFFLYIAYEVTTSYFKCFTSIVVHMSSSHTDNVNSIINLDLFLFLLHHKTF